jgi:hypothetical protein
LKVHVAIDQETQEIVAEIVTESSVSDGSMTEHLLCQVKGQIQKVLADGAYDRTNARNAIRKRGALPLIPPPKNAQFKGGNGLERDQSVLEIAGFGGELAGRSLWGKLTGYSRRSLVEAAFLRKKRLFGDRFFSQRLDKQRVESRMRCWILNQMLRVRP